jgi:peptidoglycan hydrolase CwlO-like protein
MQDLHPRRKNSYPDPARVLKDARVPNLRDRSAADRGLSGARVNLSRRRKLPRLPWVRAFQAAAVLAAAWFLVAGNIAPPRSANLADAQSTSVSASERAALETELQRLEAQMREYQVQIEGYQKQGKSLSTEVAKLNAEIAKLNTQIKSIDLTLAKLGGQITATQAKIGDLENNIDYNRELLGGMMRQLYESGSASMVEVLLQNPKLSDFFNDLNNYSLLQVNIHNVIEQVTALRDDLLGQKEQLALAKSDAETIRSFRATQATQVGSTKQEQARLLEETKGQESRYQVLLVETQKSAAEIRNRLFELLGGGSMTFEQAYSFAKVAGAATGVRPALILAVLDRESALGRNVGQCTYHTAMHPTRDVPAFLEITASLGLNPETTKVSCPNADGVYGGAMGPAQFLPSTWKGYAARVMTVSGRNTASPWTNADAFIASGLYLRDAGALSDERVAAAKYYCGGNYNRYVCLNVYAQAVIDRAAGFQADINIIGG